MTTIYNAVYSRIYSEIKNEMPDATRREQLREYRIRCDAWKKVNGIK